MLVPAIALVLSALYVWQTWGYPFDAVAFPYTVIGLMLVFVAIIVAGRLRGEDADDEAEAAVPRSHRLRAPALVAATLLYMAGMQMLGFFIATVLYLAIVMWFLGNRRPQVYVPITILVAATATFVLDRLLQISLPSFAYMQLPLGL